MSDIQVLFAQLMAVGFEDRESSRILGVSESWHSVRNYNKQVYRRYNVNVRSQLISQFSRLAEDYPLTDNERQVLGKISPEMQQILKESLHGHSYKVIGGYHNQSASTVRKKVDRVRKQLSLGNRQTLLWLYHVYQLRYGVAARISPAPNLTEETSHGISPIGR